MSQQPRPAPSGRWRMLTRLSAKQYLGIVLATLGLIFVVQNQQQADIDFLFIDLRMPLWVALALLFAVGMAAGGVLTQRRGRRQR